MSKESPEEEQEQDVIEDEIKTIVPQLENKNDRCKFTQNHYGQVKETEPSIERNSSKLGVISFFSYTARTGM